MTISRTSIGRQMSGNRKKTPFDSFKTKLSLTPKKKQKPPEPPRRVRRSRRAKRTLT